MTDEEFLGYAQLHSRTQLALFNGEQIARLYKLAVEHPDTWRSVHDYNNQNLFEAARDGVFGRTPA